MNSRIADLPNATFRETSDANAHAGTASSTRPAVAESSGVVTRIIEAPDIVLVGSGIMSSTLAVMLKRLDPRLRIQMFEVTTEIATEASEGWNNAGTGHAGVCEMSYTPTRDPDGRVPIARALRIFEQFEHSKQFWGAMAATGVVGDPTDFIHAVPHLCFVKGADDVNFLQARHAAMKDHHFFRGMQLTTDATVIQDWSLVRYLVTQGLQNMDDRMQALREFYPNARSEHWRLVQAGIRVQAIKKTDRGAVIFGTEVFSSVDRSLAALLGASPGASVSVSIALEIVRTCLPHLLASAEGRERMRQMIPTFDIDLKQPGNAALFEKSTREASERLQLLSNQ